MNDIVANKKKKEKENLRRDFEEEIRFKLLAELGSV